MRVYRLQFPDGMMLSKKFRSLEEAKEVATYFTNETPRVVTLEENEIKAVQDADPV